MNRDRTVRARPPARNGQGGYPPASKQSAAPGYDTEEEEEDYQEPERPHTSVRRYDLGDGLAYTRGNTRYTFHPNQVQRIPPRRSAYTTPGQIPGRGGPGALAAPEPVLAPRRRRGFYAHPLLYLGTGMVAMLALWVGLSIFLSWWYTWQDDLHYGRPRTYQVDQVVGHNDSPDNPTHFVAINLNSRVLIIELPGGDSSKARIYQGPTLYGQGSDLAPITLSFQDVNHDGKLDMLVHFQGSVIIYLNQGGTFVPQHLGGSNPPTPNEARA
ncbi:MAG TPA: VCBS repeat-containing protein [Ktedonobacteraceae bacterium]|nr:VCBS repeat-containing protein [Ktedonobacteraceae bacterium]